MEHETTEQPQSYFITFIILIISFSIKNYTGSDSLAYSTALIQRKLLVYGPSQRYKYLFSTLTFLFYQKKKRING